MQIFSMSMLIFFKTNAWTNSKFSYSSCDWKSFIVSVLLQKYVLKIALKYYVKFLVNGLLLKSLCRMSMFISIINIHAYHNANLRMKIVRAIFFHSYSAHMLTLHAIFFRTSCIKLFLNSMHIGVILLFWICFIPKSYSKD